jgi:DNA-binding LacI/PurR family transcriptional regulator
MKKRKRSGSARLLAADAKSQARPTQAQLAEHLGVSQATICRVFSGSNVVSKELRARVNRAIEDFGYTPNLYARGLASKRTRTIGIMAVTTTVPAHLIRLSALTSRLIGAGWSVVNALTDGRVETEQEALAQFEGRMVEGLVCLHRHHVSDALLRDRFAARGKPVVAFSCDPVPGIHTFGVDLAGGICRVVEALVERGHRRLGLVMMGSGSPEMLQREQGFRTAMAAAGLTVHEPWVIKQPLASTDRSSDAASTPLPNLDTDSDYDLGLLATRKILDQEDRPTALVCASDCMAIGALLALRERGLRVPDDMAVTGYDGLDQARFCDPPLTTVAVDYAAMGRQAADLLIAQLDDHQDTPATHRLTPGRFIPRESTRSFV